MKTGPPTPGRYPVDSGTAELLADADRRGSWMLLLDGTPQSHLDLDDASYLDFEYVRRIGHVCDLIGAPSAPIDVVHLGAGALTLARYLELTRPGSRQRVFEIDAALIELVRRELPLPRTARVRIRAADARLGVASLRDNAADLIIGDVFAGAQTPAPLTSVEFAQSVARVLRAAGVYAVNIGDGPPLRFARSQLATLGAAFSSTALIADPAVLRGRRFGNLVAVASHAELPIDELVRRCARDPWPSRVVSGAALRHWIGSARVITDDNAIRSPTPPGGIFSAR